MRHAIQGNRLNRNRSWRKATVRDIAKATLVHQRVCTTKAKAKEARKLVDRLITLGKRGTLADRRKAFAILCDHHLVKELFNKTSLRFHNRKGGYTRIIFLGTRRGDNAQLSYLELTEKEKVVVSKPRSTAEKKKEKLKAVQEKKLSASKAEGKPAQPESPIATPLPEEVTQAVSPEVPMEKESPVPTVSEEKAPPPEPQEFKKGKPKKEKSKEEPHKTPTFLQGLKKFFHYKSKE